MLKIKGYRITSRREAWWGACFHLPDSFRSAGMKKARSKAEGAFLSPLRRMPAVAPAVGGGSVLLSMVLIVAEGDITEDSSDPANI